MQRQANPKPITAMRRVHHALDTGELIRAERCEICAKTETEIRADIAERRGQWRQTRHVITAHHQEGYVNSLAVWWVCPMCNTMLEGHHDGSLTLEEARAMWRAKQGVATVALAGGRMLRVRPEGGVPAMRDLRKLEIVTIDDEDDRLVLYGADEQFHVLASAVERPNLQRGDLILYEPAGVNFGWFVSKCAHSYVKARRQVRASLAGAPAIQPRGEIAV
jgi:hypothetical protein